MNKFGLTTERYEQMMEFHHGNEQLVKSVVDDWGAEICNKGYDIFDYDNTGILDVEDIADIGAFSTSEAVEQAIKDGIEIIPVEQLPINIPKDMRFYGWIDTEENRQAIKNYCDRL